MPPKGVEYYYDPMTMSNYVVTTDADGNTQRTRVDDLAEWERELLGYSSPVRFVAGSYGPNEPKPKVTFNDPMPRSSTPKGDDKCKDPNCPMCNMTAQMQAMVSKPDNGYCSECAAKQRSLDYLKRENVNLTAKEKTAREERDKANAQVSDLTERLTEAEEQRDEYDREADDLAAALEYVTIERDYLLKIREWAEAELTRAWERIEELEHGD